LTPTAGAHTHVLEDAKGQTLRPAIMWNDQRCGAQVARERTNCGARILELSGNRISPTWTLPQLVWLREEEPHIHARIHRIRPAKDWLRRRLDGSDATDLTDAWGLMLADAHHSTWSAELCAIAALDARVLPDIVDSTTTTGTVTAGRLSAAVPTPMRKLMPPA